MKKFALIVVTVVASVAMRAEAQTNAFRITIKGTITTETGERFKVRNSALIVNPGDVLVAVVDETHHSITLCEVEPMSNTLTRFIANSRRWASAVTKFETTLGTISEDPEFNPPLPPFQGNLEFDGQFKVKHNAIAGLSARIVGIWFDPKFTGFPAQNGNLPASEFSGTMKSTFPTFTPNNF